MRLYIYIYIYIPLVVRHGNGKSMKIPSQWRVLLGKALINGPFSIAMFDYRGVDYFPPKLSI